MSSTDRIDTRVSRLLGVRYPIVQAPMGWIARAQLASAVSNAGGLGIIETSSGELDVVKDEIRKMRDLTDEPFGVNIAQLFVRDPGIVDFVVAQGVKFVTTSAGDPRKYTKQLKAAGLTVFHVVPSLDAVKDEIRLMRDLTDRPFGVNIAQAFVRDPNIAEFVIDQGVKFVTTSAGSPTRYTSILKDAGLTVYHVVPTLAAAMKAVDAGVDGLVVEGAEGGGFKSPTPVSTMVLLPLVRSRCDVPIIAAGGIVDGATMAAAFALGAEGVQMGTRMVSALESPVHDNWKQAIVAAAETDTLYLNERHSPALRALRTKRTEALVGAEHTVFGDFGNAQALYFGGDMEAAIALRGQVAGRIDEVRPVADIIADTVSEFAATVERLHTGGTP